MRISRRIECQLTARVAKRHLQDFDIGPAIESDQVPEPITICRNRFDGYHSPLGTNNFSEADSLGANIRTDFNDCVTRPANGMRDRPFSPVILPVDREWISIEIASRRQESRPCHRYARMLEIVFISPPPRVE